ncbi:hypothetical protein Pcinc_021646 [Petrolisthes cinctipes]|uniref:Uncharacterized protein n=1 Tax=Petrolisthes cinctipes TaxID=88211 RepID=A0AAE1FHJ5_PETCI|nr:hypothetical protein Pcinc_021646 [Petrolisthes cinctipes]
MSWFSRRLPTAATTFLHHDSTGVDTSTANDDDSDGDDTGGTGWIRVQVPFSPSQQLPTTPPSLASPI